MDNVMNQTQKSNLNMGYCCINMCLRKLGIFSSRTCRLDTIKERGVEYSYELAQNNLEDMACILKWNHTNNIFLYRMSSDMFPFATHPAYALRYDLSRFAGILQSLGQLAAKYNQTLTFHPGQYNQLSSHRQCVVEQAIVDINFHAKVMDLMGLGSDSVIVIHGGSKHDGKQQALARLESNFAKLSQSAQNRLVLENCEMAYSIEDLLPLCTRLQIPLVIDYHHHNINPGTVNLDDLTRRVLEVWAGRGITPLFHISESREGVTANDSITMRRAHSDFVQQLPAELLDVLCHHKINLDVEAKMKDRAVLSLFQKYNMCEVRSEGVSSIL